MITEEIAQAFANNWIAAWNTHDLTQIISHYDEDVEYHSMFVKKLINDSTGAVKGKNNLKYYLARGLLAYPNLKFQLLNVFTGISSIVLQYQSVNNLVAAETFEFNQQGLIRRVQCHYY
ncbi:MAG: nuclear transport factor 2 family protein [Aestuariibacter sp.]